MALSLPFLYLAAFTSLGYFLARLWNKRYGVNPLPGPPRWPIVGNLFDAPTTDVHKVFRSWGLKYGPVVFFKLVHRDIIIVSSHKVCIDLLEKRGVIYSDRPRFPMGDLAGWGWHAVIMSPTDAWRRRRKLIHQQFHLGVTPEVIEILQHNALYLVCEMLESPSEWREHVRRFPAANILRVVYGLNLKTLDDPYVKLVDTAMREASMLPGTYLLDLFPWLLKLPDWFPGTGFKQAAANSRRWADAIVNSPFDQVKREMLAGTALPCQVTRELETGVEDDIVVRDAAGVAYQAGAESTASTILFFILALVRHPDVQSRIHAELDRVVGSSRLPTIEDKKNLPYLEATIWETMRFYPASPLGFPHALEQDDVYENMLLRKNSMVVFNTWAIARDDKLYTDPDTFNPSRYLTPEAQFDDTVLDPRSIVFGYGRRQCPGRQFANESIYIAISTLAACFRFARAVDPESGNEIVPDPNSGIGLIASPDPFPCVVEPRGEMVARFVHEALEFAQVA